MSVSVSVALCVHWPGERQGRWGDHQYWGPQCSYSQWSSGGKSRLCHKASRQRADCQKEACRCCRQRWVDTVTKTCECKMTGVCPFLSWPIINNITMVFCVGDMHRVVSRKHMVFTPSICAQLMPTEWGAFEWTWGETELQAEKDFLGDHRGCSPSCGGKGKQTRASIWTCKQHNATFWSLYKGYVGLATGT